MKNVIRKIVIMLTSFFALTACSIFEQKEDIYILYTNDVSSNLVGDIGYAGVKGFKDEIKKDNKYVSLVDAGDYFDGEISFESDGRYIVQIMNAVGYDAVALGNQEFSIGLESLAKNIKESDFDYVSCNLEYIGKGKDPLKQVKPYVIKKYGWTKVAYIGVTTPETLTDNKPAKTAITRDGEVLYSFFEGNEGEDLYDQVQRTIDKVRKKVDYVVVIAHLGANSVSEGFSSYDLIANTNGIDVVIDGHSHTVISGEAVDNIDGEMVVLTSTGEKLQNLGVLQMHPNHTFTTTLYPMAYEKDSVIEEMIASIYEEIKE